MENAALIKVDKETLARLKILASAGGIPVAQYVRILSKTMSGIVPEAMTPIELRLDRMERDMEAIGQHMAAFLKFMGENQKIGPVFDANGKLDLGKSRRGAPSILTGNGILSLGKRDER